MNIEDGRPPADRERVGIKRNNYGIVEGPVLTTKDVPGIVRDALKAEFENNGHRIAAPEDQSDAVVLVSVKRFWVDRSLKFLDFAITGTIDADVKISPTRDTSRAVSKPLATSFREGSPLYLDTYLEQALNKTLGEFVRNFSRDPAILDALRDAR